MTAEEEVANPDQEERIVRYAVWGEMTSRDISRSVRLKVKTVNNVLRMRGIPVDHNERAGWF